jgi:hypothetical protein
MFNAAQHAEMLASARHYGFEGVGSLHDDTTTKLNWSQLVRRRDEFIRKLNGVYLRNLDQANVHVVSCFLEDQIVFVLFCFVLFLFFWRGQFKLKELFKRSAKIEPKILGGQ